MTDYSELTAAALAATQGKWTTDGVWTVMSAESDQLNGGYAVAVCHGPEAPSNAEYIARASPAVVLGLIAEIEQLRESRTDWQARCLKRGFEYVRESDDHYVLADPPEMAALLSELLGVEIRSKENDDYGQTVSDLSDQVDAGIDAFHRAYEAEKERDQLKHDHDKWESLYRNEHAAGTRLLDTLTGFINERDQLKAENEALRKALTDCSDSLYGEMIQKFGAQLPDDMHPVTRRNYDRGMAELAGYRAMIKEPA